MTDEEWLAALPHVQAYAREHQKAGRLLGWTTDDKRRVVEFWVPDDTTPTAAFPDAVGGIPVEVHVVERGRERA